VAFPVRFALDVFLAYESLNEANRFFLFFEKLEARIRL